MYVANLPNRASNKITQLTDNVYVCRSGSNPARTACNREGFCQPYQDARSLIITR
ncbi:hypothetical protein N665_0384s0030 [Sinapis alba]|nr:hypothetical protein N665_0384s0030 [Sinapis alba]